MCIPDNHVHLIVSFLLLIVSSCRPRMMKSSPLWEVVSHLLLLSHGQASVERGFSINKQIERPTCAMKGSSMIT